ncbi:spermine/spermidine synthase domain-containing protein [Lentzea tibetensis]|nr:spermidine synthase [Lentzea tibetensis]
MGELILRRRWDLTFRKEVYEIKLNDEFLMSSLFTVAEVEIGRLPLTKLAGTALDVVVGGLGLGYTAQTVLENPNVRSLVVVDALSEVIDWHERGLIPAGVTLTSDPRCTLVHGDFFAMARAATGLDPAAPERLFHAIIVDIDHSPRHLLHPSHAGFYESSGLQRLSEQLHPGGVFALWSDDRPDEDFTKALEKHFAEVEVEVVGFDNLSGKREAANTIYLAKTASAR